MFLLLFIYSILGSVGMFLIKISRFQFSFAESIFNFQVDLKFLVGIIFYLLSFLLFIFMIQKFRLTFLIPIGFALNFIFTQLIQIFILKTVVNRFDIIGFVIIIFGLIVSYIGK